MGMNISSGDEDQLNATINTTPLVDVMLVLLIVFLIAVPVALKVEKVALPNVENIPTQSKPENVVLTINKEGKVFWGPVQVTREQLVARLAEAAHKVPQPEVHIRGDRDARFEYVGRVLAAVQHSGVVRVGFLSEPRHEEE